MPTVIDNPILNSPFEEPRRHFVFDDDGITDKIAEGRRTSIYFVPIARPRKKGGQQYFDTEWTKDRIVPNKLVDEIRPKVALWRQSRYPGVTNATARLLAYWTREGRDRRLFFCQIEALETAIYITECARKFGDAWIENELREANDTCNPGLPRIALKMATGSGKTVVMAMLIAWQALNKLDNPQDARFSDTFLIVTPGITIRDRLRVLLPNDAENYYRQRDILPPQLIERLKQAKILITNYHAFHRRELGDGSRLTKRILAGLQPDADGIFRETPDQMVRRVCRELGNKKNIIVLNDEAHHCYRRRPDADDGEKLNREDKAEADARNKQAHLWLSGIEAVKKKIGIKTVYDLSATPFFLRGSGWPEGTLFRWVVSDFSLIDAIESGIVKIPRVPVADNSMMGEQPTYRDLWIRIRDDLPRKGRKTEAVSGEPKLPAELQSAIHSLYDNYRNYFKLWEANTEARARGLTPPVFIVVCNNTNVSKLVFDYIAGWDKTITGPDGQETTIPVPGQLDLFSNVEDGRWSSRPKTILVDSEQLESGEALTPEFRKIAAAEIEELKAAYRERFPGRDVDQISESDLLREVMNSVGKPGKLGESVRCVVSVSMLTEGWDANTVTHILGVRAFGTQLLCEQVVGRALRRMSYPPDVDRYPPEYAEVYGVPFSFIPCSGSQPNPKPGPMPTRIRALKERESAARIEFPRLVGYRYDIPDHQLTAAFSKDSRLILSTRHIPTKTENAPIVGEKSIHTLDDLKRRRDAEVEFLLAKLTLEKYFRQDGEHRTERTVEHRFDSEVQAWRFPRILEITREWFRGGWVECHDAAFPQLLLLLEYAHDAADRIYKAIVAGDPGSPALRPVLRPYEVLASTRHVDFDTTRPTWPTSEKCHISHVVADTGSWEQKMAQTLEEMPEVLRYVKNDRQPGFTIPYTINGEERHYHPDFIAWIDDGRGEDDPLKLIIEVTGEPKKDKQAKVSTARTLWVPAVNNHGGFGRWGFVEVEDPWNFRLPDSNTAGRGSLELGASQCR